MNHVVVFKAAHHVDDGVGFADVREEFVAQPFAGAGACDQTGDIDELDNGALDFLRVHDSRQRIKPLVRHFDDADIGLDGAKGVVFCRNACVGQCVEQGGFSDVGQANNAAFQTHHDSLKVN